MKNFIKTICIFLIILLLIGLLLLGVGAVYLQPYTNTTMDLSLLPSTKNGASARLYVAPSSQRHLRCDYQPYEEALPSSTQKYVAVTYDQLPTHLIQAFVAIEDKRFFDHQGIDLWRTAQACFYYLSGKHQTFGGSTITQQLVKNVTSQDQRTVERKLTEIFSALDMEQKLHKEEILEAYLNVINLGHGCRGVGAAASYYFGKEIQQLSLHECATLAAITNNPTFYDPHQNPDHHLKRRNLILSEMQKQGYISLEECLQSQAQPLGIQAPPTVTQEVSSWYADMVTKDVIADLQTRLGYSREEATALVYHGDLIIETAMDATLQDILTAYYENVANFPQGGDGMPQSAMMIIDPLTGDILAVAGSIGTKSGNRIQNYATDTRRPAGSCIKPLSIYAPALQEGLINYATIFEDEPLENKRDQPWPRNADGLYRGKTTVREAVALSTNTIAVKILEMLGMETSFDFLANKLHMTSLLPPDKQNAHDMTLSSLALGQQSHGVSMRELLGGYTICYDGVYRQPVSYHRVLTSSGEILLSNPCVGEVVLSQENACILTHLLEGVVQDGTASAISLGETLGISVAGKTGTTQNNCDRWFVGLTPRLAAAVWVGYEYPKELRGIEGNPCLSIWDNVMTACEQAYRGSPKTSHFKENPHVIPLTVCPHSGGLATTLCQEQLPANDSRLRLMEGWFDVANLPCQDCPLHKRDETLTVDDKDE